MNYFLHPGSSETISILKTCKSIDKMFHFHFIVFLQNFTDVNECEQPDNAGCSHTCTNTEGSYMCGCPVGLQLSNNQHTCVGERTIHITLVDV